MFPNECLESTQDFLMTRLVSAPGTSSVTDSCLPWGGPIATGLEIPYLFQLDCLQIACCSNEISSPIWGVEGWPQRCEKSTFTAVFPSVWCKIVLNPLSRWLDGCRLPSCFSSSCRLQPGVHRLHRHRCARILGEHTEKQPQVQMTQYTTWDAVWCLQMCDCIFSPYTV